MDLLPLMICFFGNCYGHDYCNNTLYMRTTYMVRHLSVEYISIHIHIKFFCFLEE